MSTGPRLITERVIDWKFASEDWPLSEFLNVIESARGGCSTDEFAKAVVLFDSGDQLLGEHASFSITIKRQETQAEAETRLAAEQMARAHAIAQAEIADRQQEGLERRSLLMLIRKYGVPVDLALEDAQS